MTPDAYKEALLVTARVTAGLALIGCGGSVTVPTDTRSPVPDPTNAQQEPPPVATAPEPEPVQKGIRVVCDPPQTDCCNAIFDRIDKDWAEYSKVNQDVLWKCCQKEDPKFTRAACTPWGPPMPPEMVS